MVDHLFRHSSGRVVASLVRQLGPQHLELAEDSFQEAMVKALRLWPYRGVPRNPQGWIRRVAFNHALDVLRRDGRKQAWNPVDESIASDEVEDVLRVMLLCCHPDISPVSQVVLMLRLVAGFDISEISHAFFTSEAAIYQRVRRAKQAIVNAAELAERLPDHPSASRTDSLLAGLYLLFNEGYAQTSGDQHVSSELCHEAIRLADLVVHSPAIDRPDAEALLALMMFQTSRLPARTNEAGEILTLAEQDRSRWNYGLIDDGITMLNRSARGEVLSSYHLQAGIASIHALAPTYESTDWPAILEQYDTLIELDHSAVVQLNRAVAYSMVYGPAAGLELLDRLLSSSILDRYALFHAAVGELASRDGRADRARKSLARARSLAGSQPERDFFTLRLADQA